MSTVFSDLINSSKQGISNHPFNFNNIHKSSPGLSPLASHRAQLAFNNEPNIPSGTLDNPVIPTDDVFIGGSSIFPSSGFDNSDNFLTDFNFSSGILSEPVFPESTEADFLANTWAGGALDHLVTNSLFPGVSSLSLDYYLDVTDISLPPEKHGRPYSTAPDGTTLWTDPDGNIPSPPAEDDSFLSLF